MNPKDYHAPMHTAEHILNQTMVRLYNRGRSISQHIEKKKSKCDYKLDRDLTGDELMDIEGRVNEVINMNLDVREEYISREEAQSLYNLEKLPEGVGDTIRIIKVGNYDACPCSGVHVQNTSEIGKFKILSTNFNDGIFRMRFKLEDTSE
jgi:Ser-tRNA(Ala) deacylase AlaX